jgi:excisionase family DNA binding protein
LVIDNRKLPQYIFRMLEQDSSDGKGQGLLRMKAAAARLGVSVRTVYRVIADGGLTLVRVRGCACIAENDLTNYISRNTQRRQNP